MALKRVSFLRNVSPRGAVTDLVHEWRRPTPHRWPILAVSMALTTGLLMVLIPESQRVEPRSPDVVWITTFDPNRTEAEIIASNRANQVRQDKLRAEQAARIERRKDFFRTLGRSTGLDVNALEKEYADDPPPVVAPPPARTPGGE